MNPTFKKYFHLIGYILVGILIMMKILHIFVHNSRLDEFVNSSIIVAVFFIILGLFILIAVIFEDEFITDNDRYLFLKKILGNIGVKILYCLLGFFFFFVSFMMIFGNS